jgi:phosphate-selective porin OprO and OprP
MDFARATGQTETMFTDSSRTGPVGNDVKVRSVGRMRAHQRALWDRRLAQGPPLARACALTACLSSCALLSLILLVAAPTPVRAAPERTELEEPGQVERRPIDEEEHQPNEATTTLPDSEAVDPTIEEDEDLHPEEATAILPDSEAVDESIVEGEAPSDEGEADAKGVPAEPPVEPQWSIRWQNAFIVERVDDPQYQFLFGGRVQNDWGLYAPDSDLENSFGNDGTGTKFRRARLYFQGQFFRYGFFKTEYDFTEGADGTQFTDVYAGLNLPKLGLIRIGRFKEPFSLEFQNSSNFLSFNERSSSFTFTPGRNSGIMMNGNFLIRDSTFALAFMRRTDDIGEGFSSKEDYHVTARITGVPYFEEGGARLLHIEFGYSHQFADQSEGTSYEQGPANDFGPILVDTGLLAVDSVDLFNVGVAVVEGRFSFQGEATLTVPRGGISENPLFWGTYAELSWWITGENRRYLRGRGVFSRVVPRRRFDVEKGQWGAIELATRYSWLDLSNDGIRGGTLGEWSAAINWVLFSNLRMSNNYVLSKTRDRPGTESGIAHSWVTRFQIDF